MSVSQNEIGGREALLAKLRRRENWAEVSIDLIETEIRRFLSTDEPEVICISGKWGVGKTFAWNRYLRDAQANNSIKLKRYSYVSLFGINSLEELKYSIFENSVRSDEIGVEPSLETLQSNTRAAAARLGRKSLWFLQQIPLLKNYVGGLGPVWFLSVKETIVCVDDIERRGKTLSVRDVLGLVSNLKEHKRCKVFFILNDQALEEDKKDFDLYLDKVVDASLKFEPSARECARIALDTDTEVGMLLAENCITLGISNIRLIKKIERAVRSIEAIVKNFDKQVLKQAVHTLALLGWSLYEPTVAPSLDYLEKRKPNFFARKEALSENEAAWNALLDAYGFRTMDEFDHILLDGIRNGFFDPSLVEKNASELDRKINAEKLVTTFRNAWGLYHDSFADNQEQVLDTIYQAFLDNIRHITPIDLNGTVWLFKELGRTDQASEMIGRFVTSRREDLKGLDLEHFPFKEQIDDPDVIEALNKCSTFKEEPNAAAILASMADRGGWNPEDIETLATLSIDEYYDIFKKTEGQALRKIIDACLLFDRISNASIPKREISRRAKAALNRIGQESPINALRVRKYGLEADALKDGGDPQV